PAGGKLRGRGPSAVSLVPEFPEPSVRQPASAARHKRAGEDLPRHGGRRSRRQQGGELLCPFCQAYPTGPRIASKKRPEWTTRLTYNDACSCPRPDRNPGTRQGVFDLWPCSHLPI